MHVADRSVKILKRAADPVENRFPHAFVAAQIGSCGKTFLQRLHGRSRIFEGGNIAGEETGAGAELFQSFEFPEFGFGA